MKDYTNTSKKNIISALRDKGVDVNDDVEWYELDDKIEQIKNATGVRHDWNENDPTKPGYIENRPFYTGDPVETVLVEESTVEFSDRGGNYGAQWPDSFESVEGKTYSVKFDGTEYNCVAQSYNSFPILGNASVFGLEDTGEPFVLLNQGGVWSIAVLDASDTSASHVLSISTFIQEVIQIDEKYLPKSAFTLAEWAKISNKIVDYKQQSLSLSVSGESIHVGTGSVNSKKINDNLKFEDGIVYEINGNITFHNPKGATPVLNINGHYECSNGKILFGSCYDNYYRENIKVGLYSSDDAYYPGELYTFAVFGVAGDPFTFDINITVTEEVKQLPDICIGKNIQRVGDDIILSSSTADSTKKFKITVDDSGTISATEVV